MQSERDVFLWIPIVSNLWMGMRDPRVGIILQTFMQLVSATTDVSNTDHSLGKKITASPYITSTNAEALCAVH